MLNWHALPLVRLIVPFAVGIVAALNFSAHLVSISIFSLTLLVVSGACALKMARAYAWRWLWGIPLSILLFLCGFACLYSRLEWHTPQFFGTKLADKTGDSYFAGTINDILEKESTWRILLDVAYVGDNKTSIAAAKGNLIVYVRKDSLAPLQYKYGDYLLLRGTPQRIEAAKNPAAFDFHRYWHLKNYHFQTFIKPDAIALLGKKAGGNVIWRTAQAAQAHFLAILKKYLTTEYSYAVGAALLLGSREAVPDEIKNAYIETGAIHILAISGMHIVLIFSRLEWLLSRYKNGHWLWRTAKFLILVVAIGGYALLTGFSASIVRAAVMSSLLLLGKTIHRRANPFNLLAGSALLLLLYEPFWLFDVGFQLSYAAVGGIYLYNQTFYRPIIFINPLANSIAQNLAICFAAQLVVTPFALYYFQQIPTYFWLSGLVVGFVSEWALLAGILLLITEGVPFLPIALGKFLDTALWLMNQLVFTFQKLPFSIISAWGISAIEIGCIAGILIGVLWAVWERQLRLFMYPLSIFLVFTLFSSFRYLKLRAQRQLVVYAVSRFSLIELLAEGKCYQFEEKNTNVDNFFLNKNTTHKRVDFAHNNYHKQLKINELLTCRSDKYEKNDFFIYHNGYMHIGREKVYILDKMPDKPLNLHIDYLIVRNNPKITMETLATKMSFGKVIFDGSNYRKRIEEWKKDCEKLSIPFHDVMTQGAWVHYF